MQWLIDIIVDLIGEVGGFNERLPPVVAPDWDSADFPTTAWYTLDCSAIVPAGTKAVLLRIITEASSSTRQMNLTVEDETAWSSMAFSRTRLANNQNMQDKVMPLTSNRTFKVRKTATGWTRFELTVAGWWGPKP